MRKLLLLLPLLIIPSRAYSQAHSAVLTWTTPSDAIATSTYNIYRAPGACPATITPGLPWRLIIATTTNAVTYTDSTITVGAWCYYVTQVQNGAESKPSPGAGGTAGPNGITTITIVVQ